MRQIHRSEQGLGRHLFEKTEPVAVWGWQPRDGVNDLWCKYVNFISNGLFVFFIFGTGFPYRSRRMGRKEHCLCLHPK